MPSSWVQQMRISFESSSFMQLNLTMGTDYGIGREATLDLSMRGLGGGPKKDQKPYQKVSEIPLLITSRRLVRVFPIVKGGLAASR
jgi:hypothetical protein